jgi:hypothetical protein
LDLAVVAGQWHTGGMTKILKAGFAAGWIVLLGIFLGRMRQFLIYWLDKGLFGGLWLFLWELVNSWLGYVVGIYLLLWLVAKWWIKYVARG